ncbi:MAG: helix-turn-helix transcriptional regulator [Oscillospiraceae bacterium]|nr:helix-turn-helix transcriptional regulator [Oscillospiraceae bacterium]
MRRNYTGKPIREQDLERDRSYPSRNEYNIFLKQDLADLNPVSVGASYRKDDGTHGIHTADCTNLYHILGGSGTLFINDEYYHVRAGDLFVVPLGARANLTAAPGDTLPHRWIGFIGVLTHDFERFPIPFTLPPELMSQLCDPKKEGRNLGSRLAADLFLIHSYMQEPVENEPDYVQKVVNLINSNYMKKISVTQMAEDFGLDRCHLSRLFKSKMNMSIRDYILQFRLSKAKRYLKHNYTVTDTAHLCGFNDRANFTKIFIREIGCSPTEWVRILEWEGWNKPQ